MDFEEDTGLETRIGHERYNLDSFLVCFFGSIGHSPEEYIGRLDNLFMTVITRFKYCIKDDTTHFSGYYALELLVNMIKRIDSAPQLAGWKLPVNQLLMKYTFYFDKLIDEVFDNLQKKEKSVQVQDRTNFIALTLPRMQLIDYFFTMVGICTSFRRSAASLLNPRIIDIIMVWVREQFGNSFVMVR